jgi:methylamine---glutamate N-methyltransferase subunit B
MTPPGRPTAVISVPEVRDYERINAELIQALDGGAGHVRLAGAEGQRFLAAGLRGPWSAVVEVEGRAGPELAAGLDAPGVVVVCRGPAADAAARGLRAGRVVMLGEAGDGLAYALEGGTVVVAGAAGHRAGLNQRGGVIVVLGALGRLAGERQAGGWFFAVQDRVGSHDGRGRRGGRFLRLPDRGDHLAGLEPADAEVLRATWLGVRPWLDPDALPVEGV